MFGGPRSDQRAVRAGTEQTAGFLGSLLSSPQALQTFLGRTQTLIPSVAESAAGLAGGGGLDAGRAVISAAQPLFERNLQSSLALNQAQASSPFSTAFGAQNIDTTARALQDFNFFQQQTLQQGQQTALDAARVIGALGQAESAGPLAVLGLASRFFQPQQEQGGGGIGGLIGGALGTIGGSFLGPVGAAAGGAVGESLFG